MTINLTAWLKAIALAHPWIGEDGRCRHSCCPESCSDPGHVQGEIAWPTTQEQMDRVTTELAEHRRSAECRHPAPCHTCQVLEGIVHDVRLTAALVGEEVR